MNVSELVSRVVQHAKGAPTPVIKQAITDTMIDLCRETGIWQAELDPQYTVSGEKVVRLVTPGVSVIHSVPAVTLDGGVFDAYTARPPRDLLLDHEPPTGQEVIATAVLLPGYGSETIPEVLEPWLEVVVDGAIARLTAIPDVSWHSPAAHDYRQGKHRHGTADILASLARLGKDDILRVRTW